MNQTQNLDEKKLNSFMEKVLSDLSGTYTTLMCGIGDRLGLFKDLASNGPASSKEFSQRTQIDERYAREWLSLMYCAQYVDYDYSTGRFILPQENMPALIQEGGPMFVAGLYQGLLGEIKNLDKLTNAFRTGGGIPATEFDKDEFEGTQRLTSAWLENLLLQQWIPAVPEVKNKLENGALAADVGCGRGKALIKLAQTFPNSMFVGYDIHEPSLDAARKNAKIAGVSERVTFVEADVAKGLPECYDLITTFDVIHDMVDPRGALRAIRKALKPDGTYLLLEINSKDKLEENFGPKGALFYGMSIMYCMTTSLAHGGEGLGTAGLPESKVKEYCNEAGFRTVHHLPVDTDFNILYEIKP